MKHKFCPLTKEDCREDCALYVEYKHNDGNKDLYTGCAFAVKANASIAAANSAHDIAENTDSLGGMNNLDCINDTLGDIYKALRNLA